FCSLSRRPEYCKPSRLLSTSCGEKVSRSLRKSATTTRDGRLLNAPDTGNCLRTHPSLSGLKAPCARKMPSGKISLPGLTPDRSGRPGIFQSTAIKVKFPHEY